MSLLAAQFFLLVVVPALLVYACFSDLFSMTISNRLCLALAGAFPLFAIVASMPLSLALWHLAAGLVVLVVSFSLFAFGWIGGGDAKFVAAAAVWIGIGQLWEYVAVSSILGGALTLAILAMRNHPLPMQIARFGWAQKLHDRKTGIPYGIALGIAAMMLLPHSEVWRTLI